MPLISWRWVSLSLKHMSQMSPTIRTHNLRPRHAKRPICVPRHRTRDTIKVCWPAAPGLELVVCLVEGRIAGRAGVDAVAGHVLIIFAGEWSLSSLFADDTELLCRYIYVSLEFLHLNKRRRDDDKITFVQNSLPFIVALLHRIGHVFGGSAGTEETA